MNMLHRAWKAMLSALALLCIGLSVLAPVVFSAPAFPQVSTQAEQDRRIDTLEHLGIDHRLTVLETTTEEMRWELRGLLGGMGGLLIDAVFRFSRRNKL